MNELLLSIYMLCQTPVFCSFSGEERVCTYLKNTALNSPKIQNCYIVRDNKLIKDN